MANQDDNLQDLLHSIGSRQSRRARDYHSPLAAPTSAFVGQPFHPSQIYQDPDARALDRVFEVDETLPNPNVPENAQQSPRDRFRSAVVYGESIGAPESLHLNSSQSSQVLENSSPFRPPGVSSPSTSFPPLATRRPLQPINQLRTPTRRLETSSSSPYFENSSPTPAGHQAWRTSFRPRVSRPRPQTTREEGLSDQTRDSSEDHENQPPVREPFPIRGSIMQHDIVPVIRIPSTNPVASGIHLVPVSKLPNSFADVFPYPFFNAVQSKCFSDVVDTDDNFVMSAPTGSGKTVILELAIARLILTVPDRHFKAVYMSPTKALCSEKYREWSKKFLPFGIQCAELTGDTSSGDGAGALRKAHIIVTTPEKWDSITRKWKDHLDNMDLVKLILIDEVHILKDPRGATLEAVVSRMKTIGASIRFVALSATLPNTSDVASWLGRNADNPSIGARMATFGEEFRPVRLEKHVYGFKHTAGRGGDWQLDETCNVNLPSILTKHSIGHPILIFCSTRNSCLKTAKFLKTKRESESGARCWWSKPSEPILSGDAELTDLLSCGVAVHHAGLSAEDRVSVEKGFVEGNVSLICCTTTLAVGINMPCHLVIIKNTLTYTDEGLRQYSDLDVLQMIGRAGRPQFRLQGAVAVIMTSQDNVDKYQRLASGQEPLESCLHVNLLEHLNAEVSLETIRDLKSAKAWLRSSFFFSRLQENPAHYNTKGNRLNQSMNAEQKVEQTIHQNTEALLALGVISNNPGLAPTPFGHAMARYCVRFQTMKSLLATPEKADVMEILSRIADAEEFRDVRLRPSDGSLYKILNSMPTIRFPLPAVNSGADKCSLIVQAELGCVELPNNASKQARARYNQAKGVIFRNIHRLIRCVIDCKVSMNDAKSVRSALTLAASLSAQVWDDWPEQLRQLPSVGPITARKLFATGVNSIDDLAEADPGQINVRLGKSSQGEKLVSIARSFPRPTIVVRLDRDTQPHINAPPVVFFRVQAGFMNPRPPASFHNTPVYVCMLVDRSDGYLIDFRRMRAIHCLEPLLLSTKISAPNQKILCHIMCDEFAGTSKTAVLDPAIPPTAFPVDMVAKQTSENLNKDTDTLRKRKRTGEATLVATNGSDGDAFGMGDLNDSDFLQAADQNKFRPVEDFEAKATWPSGSQKQDQRVAQPREGRRRKDNRYECNHRCKSKLTCKHDCCRDGLEKPPRPAKLAKTEELIGGRKGEQTVLKTKPNPPNRDSCEDDQDGADSNDSLDLFANCDSAPRSGFPFNVYSRYDQASPSLTPSAQVRNPGSVHESRRVRIESDSHSLCADDPMQDTDGLPDLDEILSTPSLPMTNKSKSGNQMPSDPAHASSFAATSYSLDSSHDIKSPDAQNSTDPEDRDTGEKYFSVPARSTASEMSNLSSQDLCLRDQSAGDVHRSSDQGGAHTEAEQQPFMNMDGIDMEILNDLRHFVKFVDE